MANTWNLDKRMALNHLIKEGYNLKTISKVIDLSVPTILKELKRGMVEKAFNEKRYVTYNYERAIYNDVKQYLDDKQMELFLTKCKEFKDEQ